MLSFACRFSDLLRTCTTSSRDIVRAFIVAPWGQRGIAHHDGLVAIRVKLGALADDPSPPTHILVTAFIMGADLGTCETCPSCGSVLAEHLEHTHWCSHCKLPADTFGAAFQASNIVLADDSGELEGCSATPQVLQQLMGDVTPDVYDVRW